jgi:hypothetical protein
MQNGIGENMDNEIKIDVANLPKCLKGSQINLIRKSEGKRGDDERLSAMRSLKTNLILTVLQFFSFILVLIPSTSDRIYIIAFETSLQKGLLPLITTLTNFSTIRLVSLKLWRKIFEYLSMILFVVLLDKLHFVNCYTYAYQNLQT